MENLGTPQRDLHALTRVLNRIEPPAARKLVIMSKRERGQITDRETEQLIHLCGVVSA
jgi:hypothetical protein